ncbi:MAG TPA: nuclear transport factor 2 family protein [Terriglobales bacterium]|nr:nuclear transport factor 2 family protein [Terriglobales bacterium]
MSRSANGPAEVAVNKSFLGVFLLAVAVAAAFAAINDNKPANPSSATAEKSGTSAADASVTELLLAQEKSLPEAEKRKDVNFFKNITTDDFLEVAADAKVYSKYEMMQGLNVVNLENYSIYDAKVLPLNDNAAVVTYDAIVQMSIGDERAPRYQHVSSVWVNQGGKWLLKFQQATAAQ